MSSFQLLRQFFTPLFGDDRSQVTARLLKILIKTSLSIIPILLAFDFYQRGVLFDLRTNLLFYFLLAHSIPILILYKGSPYYAALSYIITTWLGVSYYAWYIDGIHGPAIQMYMIITVVAAVLLNWRAAAWMSVVSLCSTWVLAIAEFNGILQPTIKTSPLQTAGDLTAIFIFLVAIIFLLVKEIRDALAKVRADFDGRLQAEKALRIGDERFRKVFHSSPAAMLITSLKDGKLLDANQAYWEFTGFNETSARGRTTVNLGVWKEDAARQKFVDLLKHRKSLRNPAYEFVNARGEQRTAIAYYDLMELGEEPAVLSIFYDVTPLKQAEEALLRSEGRLLALLEAIPDLIFEINPDGVILQFIPSEMPLALKLPGVIVGKHISEVMPLAKNQVSFAIERAITSGQVNAFEYPFQRSGKEIMLEARVVSIGADRALVIVRDVSLTKWVASERETLINELEEKNAELERFVYTVSHDLKSPLVTIVGFLGYIEDDIERGEMETLRKDVERIYKAAYKMQDLLQDLLELSRVGRAMNPPRNVSFGELVQEALELTDGRLQERGVRVVVQSDMPSVYGDKKRLLELLQNLIDNAAKYMGKQPKPVIEIGCKGVSDKRLIFFVRDNGIGVAPEYHETVFGLFNKLDASTEGTGIGLALAKRIVEFHGGRIWVESELEKGATFYFSLAPTVYDF